MIFYFFKKKLQIQKKLSHVLILENNEKVTSNVIEIFDENISDTGQFLLWLRHPDPISQTKIALLQ